MNGRESPKEMKSLSNNLTPILQVFTIGHSNRPFKDFLSLLREFFIDVVADIRRYPSSRKFPHFNQEALSKLLKAENIGYLWFEALGGRRHGEKNTQSPNTGLESLGFRNYADYMMTQEFKTAAQELLSTAAKARTAIMCAEKFYWKCHRRLLSDYLTAQGVQVIHIVETGKSYVHKLMPGVTISNDATLTYSK